MLFLIEFKREIKRIICKKKKQPVQKISIHRIMIIKYLIYSKIIEKNDDHYCLLVKEINSTILVNKI